MFYAVITACTIQGSCLALEDVHNPHETVDQCETHLSEMMDALPETVGYYFGPVRFRAMTSCMTELEYSGFLEEMQKIREEQCGFRR